MKTQAQKDHETAVIGQLVKHNGLPLHMLEQLSGKADRPFLPATLTRLKRAKRVRYNTKEGKWEAMALPPPPAPPKPKAELTEAEKGLLLSLDRSTIRWSGSELKKTAEPLLRMGLATIKTGGTKAGGWLSITAAGVDAIALFMGRTGNYHRTWKKLNAAQKQVLLHLWAVATGIERDKTSIGSASLEGLKELRLIRASMKKIYITLEGSDLLRAVMEGKEPHVRTWSSLTVHEQNVLLKVAFAKGKARWADVPSDVRDALCGAKKHLLACTGQRIHLTSQGVQLMDKLELRDIARDAVDKGLEPVVDVPEGVSIKPPVVEPPAPQTPYQAGFKDMMDASEPPKAETAPKANNARQAALKREHVFLSLFKDRLMELHQARGTTIRSVPHTEPNESGYRDRRARNSRIKYLRGLLADDIKKGLIEETEKFGSVGFRMTDKGINAFAKMNPDAFFKLNERSALRRFDDVTYKLEQLKKEQQLRVLAMFEFVPLFNAVLRWWEGHRGATMTEADHLESPHVNVATDRDKALVDELLRIRKESRF